MAKRLFIAAAFSLCYVSMYPILVGGFVMYVYPYWSPGAALAWVVGGILVQSWFCFVSTSSAPRGGPAIAARKSTLLTQVSAGVLSAASGLRGSIEHAEFYAKYSGEVGSGVLRGTRDGGDERVEAFIDWLTVDQAASPRPRNGE